LNSRYALKRLGLDVSPDARLPTDQHIILVNWNEIQSYRAQRRET